MKQQNRKWSFLVVDLPVNLNTKGKHAKVINYFGNKCVSACVFYVSQLHTLFELYISFHYIIRVLLSVYVSIPNLNKN